MPDADSTVLTVDSTVTVDSTAAAPNNVVFPPINQVLAGVQYGPNGNDFTGTAQPINVVQLTADQAAGLADITAVKLKIDQAETLVLAVPYVPTASPAVVVPVTPSDPSLCTVYGTLQTPDGQPAENVTLTFQLRTPAAVRTSRLMAGRTVTETTDSAGFFSTALERPDHLSPAGSVWVLLSPALGISPQGILFHPNADTYDIAQVIP